MILNKIKYKLSDPFIRNVGFMGGAEFIGRVSRLLSVVFLARTLTPQDYGLAAIVLTVNEFTNVFTLKSGIGSKIIQAKNEDFSTFCDTAYWMNWIFSILLCFVQCIAAFPIAWYYGNSQVILPICLTSVVYLALPIFAVQSAILFRENRLQVIAQCNLLQSIVGNAMTILFAYLGLGMWAIVLPTVLVHPIWVIIILRNCSWRPKAPFTLYRWREIAGFAANILGVELLNRLRANLDYLLVGRFIGIEALGIYYFAFNAGIGMSLSVINAFTWSIFPHLCEIKDNVKQLQQRYFNAIIKIAALFLPLIILQSALAPFYVPIVYGQKWVIAIPILILVCLSALPRPFADAASMLLQTTDKPSINLYWNLIFTVILAVCLLIAVNWGIFWVATSVLAVHILCLPIFTIWVNKYVFKTYSPN